MHVLLVALGKNRKSTHDDPKTKNEHAYSTIYAFAVFDFDKPYFTTTWQQTNKQN